MSTIDEIMAKVIESQVAAHDMAVNPTRATHDKSCAADDEVRDLIAAALADAERKGAGEMRLRIFAELGAHYGNATEMHLAVSRELDSIRALPLPAGKRQAVLLTRRQINDVMTTHYPLDSLLRENVDAFEAAVRDIEAAVLAANNMEVRRC